MSPSRTPRRRAGFTLVEVLVVIAIVAVLAALLVAAVVRVRDKADEVQARSDITQIDSAIAAFKAKVMISPPSNGGGPMGTFRLASSYATTATGVDSSGNPTYISPFTANSPEIIVLKRMFPRFNLQDNGLRKLDTTTGEPTVATGANLGTFGITAAQPVLLDPNQCLVFFLTGGAFCGYQGMSTDPTQPFAAAAGTTSTRIGPFGDIKPDKLKYVADVLEELYPQPNEPAQYAGPSGANRTRRWYVTAPQDEQQVSPKIGTYTKADDYRKWFCDPWGVPYLYLCNPLRENDYPFGSPASATTDGLAIFPFGGKHTPTDSTLPAPTPRNGFFPFRSSRTKFVNPTTHQFVSAGPNGTDLNRPVLDKGASTLQPRPRGFGPGSPPAQVVATPLNFDLFSPESGVYSGTTDGADDLSNIHGKRLGTQ